MKTFMWLLKREFWEHKTGFLWAPVCVGILVFLLILLWGIAKLLFGLEGNLIVNGQSLDLVSLLTIESHGLPSEIFLHAYFALWLLEFGLLAIVTYTYCLGALFDDRKDRSILFWKSMPIPDIQVMLSKIGLAMIIGPLITGAVTTLTAAAVLLVLWTVAASNNAGNFGTGVFLQMLLHIPMKMLLVMPLNVLWATPCVGWLLMVSSMARSKPLLWALGTPAFLLIAGEAVLSTLNSQLHSSESFSIAFMRLELGVLPGSWIMTGSTDDAPSFANGTWEYFLKSFFLANDAGLWLGVLAGLAMGYVALRKRREAVEI